MSSLLSVSCCIPLVPSTYSCSVGLHSFGPPPLFRPPNTSSSCRLFMEKPFVGRLWSILTTCPTRESYPFLVNLVIDSSSNNFLSSWIYYVLGLLPNFAPFFFAVNLWIPFYFFKVFKLLEGVDIYIRIKNIGYIGF